MIAFLDYQWVTERRRLAEHRRARRRFAFSAVVTVLLALAAFALAIYSRPWLAVLAVIGAVWCYAYNCAALSQLCQLARERRGEGRPK